MLCLSQVVEADRWCHKMRGPRPAAGHRVKALVDGERLDADTHGRLKTDPYPAFARFPRPLLNGDENHQTGRLHMTREPYFRWPRA